MHAAAYDLKTCSVCKQRKPLDQFSKDKIRKDGRMCRCRECDTARAAAYYALHRDRITAQRPAWTPSIPCRTCSAIVAEKQHTYCAACRDLDRTRNYVVGIAACPCCHQTFDVWARFKSQKFCSRACRDEAARQPRPERRKFKLTIIQVEGRSHRAPRVWCGGNCLHCAQPFIARSRSKYCSRLCMKRHHRTADNHRQRARRRAQMKKPEGSALVYRAKIIERDGGRCQLCRRKVKLNATVPHPLAPTLDHIVPLALGGTHEPHNVQLAHFLCNSTKSHVGTGDQLLLVG